MAEGRTLRWAMAASFVTALYVPACSMAPQAPADPAGQVEPLAVTPDQAEAQFADAEDELSRVMLTDSGGVLREDDAVDVDPTYANTPAPSPPRTSESKTPTSRSMSKKKALSRCHRACKALGSMQRSAARLCELTGSEDERCASVSRRVEQAEDMVRRSCPECAT
jgi:hypothetical protein